MVYMVTEKNVLFRSEKHFLKGCKKKKYIQYIILFDFVYKLTYTE